MIPPDHPAHLNQDSSSKPGSDEPLRAAIYARTSSSSQRFGYSIGEQVRQCWAQCEQADWPVHYILVDEAESGRDTDRPQFQMMLKRARQGRIDVVVFWKLDRFCRSLKDLVTTAERLSDYDVSLQSVTEYIDTTTPVGRFNFRNLASAAELESDLTGQRAQMGMYGLAREGKWPNASPPLGYTRNDDGTLELCDRERTLVERIFRLYLETKSMPEVAYQLNSDGERTNNGGEWCRQSVKRILSNELYVGRYCVAEFETRIEEYRLIEDPLFDAVTNVRYRFQYSKERMSHGRKQSKADQVKAAYLKALPQD